MDTKEAVKLLRENGYIVNKFKKGWHVLRPFSTEETFYSNRELIKQANNELAPHYNKKEAKHFRHRNNRHHTKQSINHGKYEEFFSGKLRKDENIWNWD
jgi:DNA-binding GntR family transcriptional regulator